jgi:Zn finger protein HypA/HybF involved in hydrogenase expression
MDNCKHGIPGLGTFLSKIGIKRIEEPDTLRCPKCKGLGWDTKIFHEDHKTDNCPKCGTLMVHPYHLFKIYQCCVCHEIV